MNDIIFNISGGNNQIFPSATHINQNINLDHQSKKVVETPTEDASPAEATPSTPSPEEDALARFINPDNLQSYISKLRNCQTAFDVSKVVIDMLQKEPLLNKDEIVKGRFIKCLFPFITHIAKGASEDNIRVQINKELEKLPHNLRTSR